MRRSRNSKAASATPRRNLRRPRRARAGAQRIGGATRDLDEARSRVENLSQRVADLDRQLIIAGQGSGNARQPRQRSRSRLATQGKLLAERDNENNQLTPGRVAAERTVKRIARRNRGLERRQIAGMEKMRNEKAAVKEQLRIARDERAKLQRDINVIQQQAESSWATERMENALLRERINDIAAEVAKLAMQLEGPEFADRGHVGGGTGRAEAPASRQRRPRRPPSAPEGGGTLADRIRALQSHASRARQQGA